MGDRDTVSTNTDVYSQPLIVVRSHPGCLIQFIFFLFIGWWLGAAAVSIAYLLFLTVIGIPLGVMLINKTPYLMALRETDTVVTYYGQTVKQHNILLRGLWFIVAGWWITALWLAIGYFFACTIIGMPIGFWMFDQAPALLTLHRS